MCFCFTSRLWKSAFYGQALWYVFRAIREEIYWLIIAGQVQRGEWRMYKRNTRAQTRHRARLFPSCQAWRPLTVFSSSWSHSCVGFNAQVAGSVLNWLIKTCGQKRLGSGLKLPHKNVTFNHGGSLKLDRNCERCTTQNVALNKKKKNVQETFHYKSDPKIQFHLDSAHENIWEHGGEFRTHCNISSRVSFAYTASLEEAITTHYTEFFWISAWIDKCFFSPLFHLCSPSSDEVHFKMST